MLGVASSDAMISKKYNNALMHGSMDGKYVDLM